ncbi:hypothetical protein DACRYDRAFT_117882 [Dacryopinax primogenitus]|uniref:F-box domain-containing protein n=1 Tax=Dacryopinax primogenitus (strain DJM 731) TaxID=1858805 RepID=M5G7G5_DACPD|nr:uncharacterized protein DACRYDRAFT_117882 [Dacryopinax primogenitus]EJT99697.1 hypothetical protein DACRYDRAFT_117882 [Dacryopinax primogenitus]
MAMHAGNGLPFDIWNDIVAIVEDRNDLVQLCLVNSMINRIAARRLYTSLSFGKAKNIAKCYRTMMGNAILAGHVVALRFASTRYYTFDLSVYSEDRTANWLPAAAFLRLIFRLIGCLVNLKELDFPYDFGQYAISLAFSVNLGQLRPRLSKFGFTNLYGCSALPLLRTQSSLEYLLLEYSIFLAT